MPIERDLRLVESLADDARSPDPEGSPEGLVLLREVTAGDEFEASEENSTLSCDLCETEWGPFDVESDSCGRIVRVVCSDCSTQKD